VDTERYRQPQLAWVVEGIAVIADGVLSLNLIVGTFDGHHSKFGPKTVTMQCKLVNGDLTLRTIGTEANFDVTVSCSVTDGSITGNVKTNVIAKPAVTVGFVGAELTVDPEYHRQRVECEKAAVNLFKDHSQSKPKVKIGDPVEFGPGVLGDVPTYARLHQYAQAHRVIDLARMAHATLPPEVATLLTASLVADVPALQSALDLRKRATHEQPSYDKGETSG
jgi:hypothetical protein